MSIRKFLIIAVLAGLVCYLPSPASAHVLKTDGQIGAVMHISPDDNPESGQPISYQLVFNDTSGRFKLSQCSCTASIQDSTSRLIKTGPLPASHELDSTNVVTLPEPGVYSLRIHGEPKDSKATFQAFTLAYAIRVNPGGVQFQAVPTLMWAGLGGIIALALLAAYKEEHDNSPQNVKKRGALQ